MIQARRKPSGFPRRVSTALAVALACFTFYTAAAGVFLPMIQRGVHLCVVIALVFLWYPARRNSPRKAPSWLDVCCCALSLLILSWVLYSHERLLVRIPFYSKMEDADIMSALTMTLLVLEAARRTVGWPLVLTALAFILYALLGPWAPGVLMHGGMTLTRFCDQVFLTTEGFFSSLVGSSATILYCFVAFGAFLQLTGADRAYMNICLALTGRARGGAAKVSILSSMLFGSISGSTIANVVSTGTLTIPLMKKTGYLPHEAAAVETAASSAGQIMPPIMGTCAFIMADLVSVRYGDIVSISYIPAVMYFASLWFIVHKIACMRGFSGCGEESLPALRRSLLRAIPVFLPVLLLVAMMLFNFTPFLSGSLCTVLLAFIGLFFDPVDASATGSGRGIFRYSFSEFLHTLERCAVNMCSITATVACATLVVAMVNKTGLMLKSTSLMLSIAGTSWEMNLLCLAVMAYVIGMGLPTSSAYVLLAALGAPALIKCGLPPMTAHLVILWFTQLSTITPPVCMTAFAAANIAGSDPMRTGFASLKMAMGFYYIPLFFVYSPLLSGAPLLRLGVGALLLAGVFFMVSGLEGYLRGNLNPMGRALCFGAAACFFAVAMML